MTTASRRAEAHVTKASAPGGWGGETVNRDASTCWPRWVHDEGRDPSSFVAPVVVWTNSVAVPVGPTQVRRWRRARPCAPATSRRGPGHPRRIEHPYPAYCTPRFEATKRTPANHVAKLRRGDIVGDRQPGERCLPRAPGHCGGQVVEQGGEPAAADETFDEVERGLRRYRFG